jgi:hypothetical protein
MTDTAPNVKTLLLLQAQALRTQADTLEAHAKALPDGEADDPLLDCESCETEGISGNTARTWIKSGRLVASRAERGRYVFRRSALRAAIESSPAQPRPRKVAPASDLDAWERDADKTLHALSGGRR